MVRLVRRRVGADEWVRLLAQYTPSFFLTQLLIYPVAELLLPLLVTFIVAVIEEKALYRLWTAVF